MATTTPPATEAAVGQGIASNPTTTLPSPQADSSLLRLPPELRNRIYHYTLTSDSNKRIKFDNIATPPLTLTCHQILTEALLTLLRLQHLHPPNQTRPNHTKLPPAATDPDHHARMDPQTSEDPGDANTNIYP